MIDETEKLTKFKNWLANASTGDQILYLQADHASRSPKVQKFFMRSAERGEVFLFQKRVRFGIYNYYAKRLSPKAGRILAAWEIE